MVRGLLPYAVFIEYVYLHLNGCIGVNVSTYSVCVNQVKYGVNLSVMWWKGMYAEYDWCIYWVMKRVKWIYEHKCKCLPFYVVCYMFIKIMVLWFAYFDLVLHRKPGICVNFCQTEKYPKCEAFLWGTNLDFAWRLFLWGYQGSCYWLLITVLEVCFNNVLKRETRLRYMLQFYRYERHAKRQILTDIGGIKDLDLKINVNVKIEGDKWILLVRKLLLFFVYCELSLCFYWTNSILS